MIHDLQTLLKHFCVYIVMSGKKLPFSANDKLKQSICVSIKYIVLAIKEIVSDWRKFSDFLFIHHMLPLNSAAFYKWQENVLNKVLNFCV